MADPPASLAYSYVVSRNSIIIAFVIVALNILYVLVAEIVNAYLNDPCREKSTLHMNLILVIVKIPMQLFSVLCTDSSPRDLVGEHTVMIP